MDTQAIVKRSSLHVSGDAVKFDVMFEGVPGTFALWIPLPSPLTKAQVAAAVRAKVESKAAELKAERTVDAALQKLPDKDFSFTVDMVFPEGVTP